MVISLKCILFSILFSSFFVSNALANTFKVGAVSDLYCTHNTIQAAIQAAFDNGPGKDSIVLADNQPYTNQRLTIFWQSVSIIGGRETCSGGLTGGRTSIEGDGSHSIFEIAGDDGTRREVLLRDLDLSGGGADIDHGGGIQVAGRNLVTLDNLNVHNNASARGAGIYFDGSADALLRVTNGSYIGGFNNATVAGGGLYCVDALYGSSAPIMITDSTVAFNTAPEGGGIYLDNCYMQFYSHTTGFGVLFNEASSGGGGVFAVNGSTAFFDAGNNSGDEARIMITGNQTAGGGGGGVYLDASRGVFKDSEISSNQALNGSGGGVLALNGSEVRLQAEFNQHCPEACSRLKNNKAIFGGGIKADDSKVTVEHTKVTGNEAGRASAIYALNGDVSVHGSIFAENLGADAVVEFQSAKTEIRYTTFADNLNQVTDIVATIDKTDYLTVLSSIFHENHGTVAQVAPVDTNTRFECLLVHDRTGLPRSNSIHLDDPMFVDRAADNYHLSVASPAIDFCDNRAGEEFDINQQQRGIDSKIHTDFLGIYDIGADEFNDFMFADSFESPP